MSALGTEFLKATITRLHKQFKILCKFWTNEKMALISCISHNLKKVVLASLAWISLLKHGSAQKKKKLEYFDCAKEFAFGNSGCG